MSVARPVALAALLPKRRGGQGSQKVGSEAKALCPRLQGHSRSKRYLLGLRRNDAAGDWFLCKQKSEQSEVRSDVVSHPILLRKGVFISIMIHKEVIANEIIIASITTHYNLSYGFHHKSNVTAPLAKGGYIVDHYFG